MAIRLPSPWLRRLGEVSVVCTASAAFVPFAPAVMAGSGLRPLDIALVVGFLILSLGIHEAAHAWVAYRCGDSTARDMGRMTILGIGYSVIIRIALGITVTIVALALILTHVITSDALQKFVKVNQPDVAAVVNIDALKHDPIYYWLTLTVVSFVA